MIFLVLKGLEKLGETFLNSVFWFFNQGKVQLASSSRGGCYTSLNSGSTAENSRLAGEAGAPASAESAVAYLDIKLYDKHDKIVGIIGAHASPPPK